MEHPPGEAWLGLVEPRSWNPDLPGTYDRVARPYADQFFTELERKPFDRELLDRFAERMRGRGRVCDLGCRPGHVGVISTSEGSTSSASTCRRPWSRSPAS